MNMTRREFAGAVTGLAGATTLGWTPMPFSGPDPCRLPPGIQALTPRTDGVTPIGDDERRARLARAQRLMAEQEIGAVLVEPGSSMYYYTGVNWSRSERTFAMVIPPSGAPAWVCPAFEEARARELIRFGDDIRVWQEEESPFARIAAILEDRGAASGRVGVE